MSVNTPFSDERNEIFVPDCSAEKGFEMFFDAINRVWKKTKKILQDITNFTDTCF